MFLFKARGDCSINLGPIEMKHRFVGPPPVIVTIRENKDYTRVLLYSYYTTITERGGGSPKIEITRGASGCLITKQSEPGWDWQEMLLECVDSEDAVGFFQGWSYKNLLL